MKSLFFVCILTLIISVINAQKPPSKKIAVIGYYAGDASQVESYPVEKLTHIIFSFCHLRGNELVADNQEDTLTIQRLVTLKKRNSTLKVILSLGGWGGCKTCSPVFSTDSGRMKFAQSVKKLNDYFKTDGIDLDWEYPAIEGFPGHAYMPQDRHNFTLLVQALRQQLGSVPEISFAAGGFTKFLKESIEWEQVMPLVNKVNLMTYDLINGNSTITGHHTPLYSTKEQIESTDNAVRYLDSIGVLKNKIIIGAAIYARVFDVSQDANNGLYQQGKFSKYVPFKNLNKDSLQKNNFTFFWDDVAKAPYLYSSAKKQFITFDDERSMTLKTKYAVQEKLGGIMFWQLGDDKPADGLLDAIDKALH